MAVVEITPASIRFAALNLLAMREHSAKELLQKLGRKFEQQDWILAVVVRLQEEGLQSDARFSEAFVSMRKRQGKGPLLIAMELKERGVDSHLINEFVAAGEPEWRDLALSIKQRKFGYDAPMNMKEKAKQTRFLAARGFSSAAIHYALS